MRPNFILPKSLAVIIVAILGGFLSDFVHNISEKANISISPKRTSRDHQFKSKLHQIKVN